MDKDFKILLCGLAVYLGGVVVSYGYFVTDPYWTWDTKIVEETSMIEAMMWPVILPLHVSRIVWGD